VSAEHVATIPTCASCGARWLAFWTADDPPELIVLCRTCADEVPVRWPP